MCSNGVTMPGHARPAHPLLLHLTGSRRIALDPHEIYYLEAAGDETIVRKRGRGTPSIDRAAHLAEVPLPMLFLAGTRDTLAELDLLTPVCEELGPRATLHLIDGADHGFHVLKRSGRTDREVLDELGAVAGAWAAELKPC